MGCKDIPNGRKNKEMVEKMRFPVCQGLFRPALTALKDSDTSRRKPASPDLHT